jgi:hypothetical protein
MKKVRIFARCFPKSSTMPAKVLANFGPDFAWEGEEIRLPGRMGRCLFWTTTMKHV